jgi:hemoglobin-like flavoprotein
MLGEDQKKRVRAGFAALEGRLEELVETFYVELFARAPGVRPLFASDLAPQRGKLASTLRLAVRSLDDLGALVPALEAMGRRHVGYGAKPEHFAVVGEALIAAIDRHAGGLDDADRDAWVAVYGILASTMQRGMTEADAA